MNLIKGKGKPILGLLLLATFVAVFFNFKTIMMMLEIFLFVFFMMCSYANEHNINNPILGYFVKKCEKQGIPAKETYKKGMIVSGCLFFVIPLLYNWAKA